ncbi:MAG: hypothetical protein CTY37_08575 [Methylotenera sp.]|nr:MAG: hypothetical protein CTY37_08575 [Methylotenera sp.]
MKFSAAISQLKISLETAKTNAPIYRTEGNHLQADLCDANAVDFEAAIVCLEKEAAWDESRMKAIGQNGNEGLHYDEVGQG